ncbi:MAG: hypothetical protein EOP07_03795 [Proteobacteria bacterium]|nr:MAG: hypothetical protein EOP07_03795 [Pseudomonadota bacterium]
MDFINHFAVSMLFLTTSIFGVKVIPDSPSDQWKMSRSEVFQLNGDGWYEAQMTSSAIVDACKSDKAAFIDFPAVVHGAHVVKLDGREIQRLGDPSFKKVHSLFGTFSIACADLTQGQELEWTAYSYTKYFARISYWPHLVKSLPMHNFFYETLNIICGGGLLIVFIMCVLVFLGKMSRDLTVSFALASLSFSIYLFFSSPYLFGLSLDMLFTHKLTDGALWLGSGFLFYAFEKTGIIGRKNLIFYLACLLVGLFFIVAGKSGDAVQFGTNFPMLPYIITMSIALAALLRKSIHQGFDRSSTMKIISLTLFVLLTISDLLIIEGLMTGPMLGSVAILGGIVFFALYLVEGIKAVYAERDVLNLKAEVYEKSAEIQNMLESIPVGILSIESRNGKLIIGEDFSKFLVESLSIRSVKELSFDALLDRIGITADNREMITNALHSCIHESEISWELNSAHFPATSTSSSLTTDENEHYYRMTWSPLLVEGKIDKILVTISDETLLQAAKKSAIKSEGKLQIIGELIACDWRKIGIFFQNFSRNIEDLQKLVKVPDMDQRRIKLVAHTLKGETRTLRLTGLTERIHNFEDAVVMGLNIERPMKELIKTFNIYETQRSEIFGRTEAQGKIFVDEDDLRAAINGERTDRIQHYINKSAINFFADLPSIRMLGISAKSLEKLALITINDKQGPHFVDIKDSTFFESIMVHLVGNAIDHGIESPEERSVMGKKPSGLITIDVYDNSFVFRDDGRGLDLEMIREKMAELHKTDVKKFENFADETDADAIFLPGLTTKDEVSVVSGRGIGMDAIRTMLERRGGTIAVKLGERKGRFASFELVISIPGMIRTDLRSRSNLNATWTIEPATPTRA